MKFIDNVPIFIVIAALLINIAFGAVNGIDFTSLMIRCMVITIVFGTFGYLITETIKSAVECSDLKKFSKNKDIEAEGQEENLNIGSNEPIIDIRVPSMNVDEFEAINYDSGNEFVEMNPAYMSDYIRDNQD